MIPVICIEGPTASGKSAVAMKLARAFDTEIVSADSRQIYKYLDIGTAKPDINTLSEIKHHLIDVIYPDQKYSAGAFANDAELIINTMHEESKIPIICGGSMLYIKSLLYGLSDIPPISLETSLQTEKFMKTHTLAESFEFVSKIDQKFASLISPNDKQRIFRALDVWFAFEKPLTDFWTDTEIRCQYKPFRIYIKRERNELYSRINHRMLSMIKQGLIKEIKSILDMGYSTKDYGLNSVGYVEFIETKGLKDDVHLESCIQSASQHSRNLAKRQITWYNKTEFDFILDDDDVDINVLKDDILTFFEK